MCDIDDESRFTAQTWRRARKAHRCYACRETIRPGDRYHHTAQENNGSVDTMRHCARCRMIIEALWKAGVATVDWSLDCGYRWEETEAADGGQEPAHLAFLTRDDAQALLAEAP